MTRIRITLFSLLLVAVARPALAQGPAPAVEIFGGYSLLPVANPVEDLPEARFLPDACVLDDGFPTVRSCARATPQPAVGFVARIHPRRLRHFCC